MHGLDSAVSASKRVAKALRWQKRTWHTNCSNTVAKIPSLPIEILETIIEILISEEEVEFLPRWFLTPLLRVCKAWHAVAEEHLYRCVSVGVAFPSAERDAPVRRGCEVADDFLEALMTSPGLRPGALVDELHLGIQYGDFVASTKTHTRILRFCPNVTRVRVRGLQRSDMDILTAALKQNAAKLVAFHVCPLYLPNPRHPGKMGAGVQRLQLFELLQCWPQLRTLRVEAVQITDGWTREVHPMSPFDADTFDPSAAFHCLPALQDISFQEICLSDKDFQLLRIMCNNVTRIDVHVVDLMIGSPVVRALCDCLIAWTPTLVWVSLTLHFDGAEVNNLLAEAIRRALRLRELHLELWDVDFGSLAELPRLEHLQLTPCLSEERTSELVRHLETPEKFSALAHIVTHPPVGQGVSGFSEQLTSICRARNIELERWTGHNKTSLTSFMH